MSVQIGNTYQDVITGFTGICTGLVEYISGCNQALLVPKSEGSKPSDATWFDVQRLVVTDAPQITLNNGATPGCDMAAPTR